MESSKAAIQTFYALSNDMQQLQWRIQQAQLRLGEKEAHRRRATEIKERENEARQLEEQELATQVCLTVPSRSDE